MVLVAMVAVAGQISVDPDPVAERNSDWLVYDDGTASWLTWGGMYRGVWFNVDDFFPGAAGASIYQSEFWFYHHSSYPWDTSDVYLEIWNGDNMGPVTQLDQTMVTAVHYAPVYATYTPPLAAEQEFWALANTEMSAGGWPSTLGDGTPGTHSYSSDDFIIWEPWGVMGDFFVRIYVEPVMSLDNSTWGGLKTIF